MLSVFIGYPSSLLLRSVELAVSLTYNRSNISCPKREPKMAIIDVKCQSRFIIFNCAVDLRLQRLADYIL